MHIPKYVKALINNDKNLASEIETFEKELIKKRRDGKELMYGDFVFPSKDQLRELESFMEYPYKIYNEKTNDLSGNFRKIWTDLQLISRIGTCSGKYIWENGHLLVVNKNNTIE